MPEVGNIVLETGSVTGTGNVTVASYHHFRRFSDVFGTSGTQFYYCIRHRTANEFEVGYGHMSSASTLVRDSVIESSNSNSLVNFSSGNKDVICDIPASYQASLADDNTWTGQQTFNSSAPIFGTMTAGSVLFAGTSGLLSQDNANLFYDDSLNRFGVGTNTPALTFHAESNSISTPNIARFRNLGSTSDTYLDIGVGFSGQYDDEILFSRNASIYQRMDAYGVVYMKPLIMGGTNLIQSETNGYNSIQPNDGSDNLTIEAVQQIRFKTQYTQRAVLNNAGFFGVNEGTPTATIHAKGSGSTYSDKVFKLTNSSNVVQMVVTGDTRTYIGADTGQDAALVVTNPASGGHAAIAAFKDLSQTGTPELIFYAGANTIAQAIAGTSGYLTWGNSGVSTSQLVLKTSTGQIGIGVSPGAAVLSGALHVAAPAATIYGLFNAVSSGYAYHTYQFNGTVIGYLGQGNGVISGGSATDFGWRSENDLVFAAGGAAEAMRIKSTGRVGIGITSPSGPLDVKTGASSGFYCTQQNSKTSIQATNGADPISGYTDLLLNYAAGSVGIGTDTPATYGGLAVRRAVSASGITGNASAHFSDASNSSFYISHGSGYVNLSSDAGLIFSTNNGAVTEAVRILGSGKVGIGTSAPDKKLEINLGTSDALRLTYNDANGSAANYTDFTVSSGGNLTVAPSGGTSNFTGDTKASGNVYATATGSYPVMMGVSPDLAAQPYRGIWIGQTSPDTSNYSFLGSSTGQTLFNGLNSCEFRTRNVTGLIVIEDSVGSGVPRSVFTYLADYTKGDTTATVSIIPSNGTSYKGLVIKQNTSQAQNLLEFQDTSAAVLAAFDANAALTAPSFNGVALSSSGSASKMLTELGTYVTAQVTLGAATVDMTSTTAVQIGTTPNNGLRFIPLEIILICTAASSPTGIGSATLGVGQTGAGYTDWMFAFLDASFDTQHEVYRYSLPASATAILSAPANTAIYAKMGTAISGGTMTMKVLVRGICV